MSTQPGAVIVGSGLITTTHLTASSIPFLLLEAFDAIGNRIHIDYLNNFLFDCSFQILLATYPKAHCILNYSSLCLHPFYPGALVYHARRFHHVSDPFHHPLYAFASLPNPIDSLQDKLLANFTHLRTTYLPDSLLLSAPKSTISAHLRFVGFFPAIVDFFFHPFLTEVGEPGDVAAGVDREEEGLGRGVELGTDNVRRWGSEGANNRR